MRKVERSEIPKIGAVLDTNVIISALLTRGRTPDQVVRQAGLTYQFCTSHELLEEIEGVLHEPKIQKRSGMTEAEMSAFLTNLRSVAVVVEALPALQVIKDDPDDDLILACAVKAQADYLVSGDTHLLQLQTYEGIQIVSPAQFLTILQQSQGKKEKNNPRHPL